MGARFSGANMSPSASAGTRTPAVCTHIRFDLGVNRLAAAVPGWLCGAQHVALNMTRCDLPVQLHFALFKGSGGFVLKPHEQRSPQTRLHAPALSDIDEQECRITNAHKPGLGDQSPTPLPRSWCTSRMSRATRESRATSESSDRRRTSKASSRASFSGSIKLGPQHAGAAVLEGSSHANVEAYWPPPRETLQRTSLMLLSLHNLPTVRSPPACCPLLY